MRPNRRKKSILVTYNVEVGRNDQEVLKVIKKILRRHRPKVLALQECRPYLDVLDDIFNHSLYAPSGKSGEAGNCAIIVRDRDWIDVIKSVIRLKHPWKGPKAGKPHDGRIFVGVELPNWKIDCVHRTRPSWSEDGKAFTEEFLALYESGKDALARGLFYVQVGDQNIGTRPDDRKLKGGPWSMAKKLGGKVITPSAGRVDSAIVGPGIEGEAKDIGKFGSDHSAVKFKLYVDSRK